MPDLKRISGIDINEDIDYQWREWRAQRIAWVFFGMILLAALLGLFGQGPLSKGRLGEPDSALSIEYEQIDRYQAPTDMTIFVGSNVAQEGLIRLSFNKEFMERVEVRQFVPEPESVLVGGEDVVYEFRVTDSAQPVEVRVDFEHEQAGLARGELRLEGAGSALEFASFVFP
jgi:hypothetical protein